MKETLTSQEIVRLGELEKVIQRGKETFVEVGTALAEIRDSRIYRAEFKTFEEYCEKRWEFSKRQCDRLIQAAKITENLGPMGPIPTSERQARPLAKLPAEQQPAAWEKAQEKAKEEGKPVTSRHVEEAVAEIVAPDDTESIVVDGTKCEPEFVGPDPTITPERGLGLTYAREAIFTLNRIPKRDPSRQQAIKMVEEWLEQNKK